jgi:hypothetical protein
MIAEHPVELATLPDARQIAEMSRDYIEYGLPWGWSEARVAGAIRNPDANVAVVREGDRVAGFGIMGCAVLTGPRGSANHGSVARWASPQHPSRSTSRRRSSCSC